LITDIDTLIDELGAALRENGIFAENWKIDRKAR